MRRALLALLFLGTLSSCNSTKTEIEEFESNKQIVEKEFPNYHVTTFRQYNYVFQISNPEYIIKVTLEDQKIVKKDTLRSFNSYAKN